jgi:thioredoxin-related protein
MKKYTFLMLLVVGCFGISNGQSHDTGEPAPVNTAGVKWMTFEKAVAKSKVQKKKIFIDVFTDWCGWCKVMDKNTFSEAQVAKILNEDFYPVKFNAEQREDIQFNGTTFKFIPNGNSGVHQLAASLLNNQLSYPTVVFLDEEFRIIQPLPGYQKAPEFHKIIQFIGQDHYKSIKWDQWQNTYKSPYKGNAGE